MNQLKHLFISSRLGLLLITALFFSCRESEYTRLVKAELGKQVRNDHLFLDFYLGDSRKEFFRKGWEINRTGKIKQGPNNKTVQWVWEPANDAAGSPIRMQFYPQFDSLDRIHIMDISFDYQAWSPLSSKYTADSLIAVVQDTLLSWYGGNSFMKLEFETEPKSIWVKVDGNRLISLTVKDAQYITGKMEDLTVKYKNKL